MKLRCSLLLSLSLIAFSPLVAEAQTSSVPQPGLIPPGPSARDGFTRSGTDILYTRQGITARVSSEVRLPNGVRVQPDGTVIRPDGTRTTLNSNQILTLDGRIADTPLTPAGTAPVSAVVPGGGGRLVPSSPVEGIRVSGTQAYVTRGGTTSKLSAELRFENGLRVRPDGSMTLPNGSETTLAENQMLTLRGQVVEAPVNLR